MIFKTRNYLPVVVCIFLASTASCGKDSPTEPVPQTPARVTLSSEEETLTAVGQTIQLTATVLDQENRVISGAVVTWTSTNPSVVKVDTNGLVTALTNGYVQIAASSGGPDCQREHHRRAGSRSDRGHAVVLYPQCAR